MVAATALIIAGEVLTRAYDIDPRIRFTKETVKAWATCFEGVKVFPEEALAAVHHHYNQPNAFVILPGDVIGYCAMCPPYSSAEHATFFLDYWVTYPHSDAIEDQSGIKPPEFPLPAYVTGDSERQYLIEQLTHWVDANRDELVAAILARRFNPVPR